MDPLIAAAAFGLSHADRFFPDDAHEIHFDGLDWLETHAFGEVLERDHTGGQVAIHYDGWAYTVVFLGGKATYHGRCRGYCDECGSKLGEGAEVEDGRFSYAYGDIDAIGGGVELSGCESCCTHLRKLAREVA